MDSKNKDGGHCSNNNEMAKSSNNEDDWETEVISTIPQVTKNVHFSDDDDWEGPNEGHLVTNGSEWDFNNWRAGVSLWDKETIVEDSSYQDASSDGFRVNTALNRTFAFAKRDSNRQRVPGKNNNNLDVDMVDTSLCDQLAGVSLKPQNYPAGAGDTEFRRGRKRNSARRAVTDGNSWKYTDDDSIDYDDGIPFEKFALVFGSS